MALWKVKIEDGFVKNAIFEARKIEMISAY